MKGWVNGDEKIIHKMFEVNLLERGSLEDQEGDERVNYHECYGSIF